MKKLFRNVSVIIVWAAMCGWGENVRARMCTHARTHKCESCVIHRKAKRSYYDHNNCDFVHSLFFGRTVSVTENILAIYVVCLVITFPLFMVSTSRKEWVKDTHIRSLTSTSLFLAKRKWKKNNLSKIYGGLCFESLRFNSIFRHLSVVFTRSHISRVNKTRTDTHARARTLPYENTHAHTYHLSQLVKVSAK